MSKFKAGDRVMLARFQCATTRHDSDIGQFGTVLEEGQDIEAVWVEFDTPTRYGAGVNVCAYSTGGGIKLPGKAGYCDCLLPDELDLVTFEQEQKKLAALVTLLDAMGVSAWTLHAYTEALDLRAQLKEDPDMDPHVSVAVYHQSMCDESRDLAMHLTAEVQRLFEDLGNLPK